MPLKRIIDKICTKNFCNLILNTLRNRFRACLARSNRKNMQLHTYPSPIHRAQTRNFSFTLHVVYRISTKFRGGRGRQGRRESGLPSKSAFRCPRTVKRAPADRQCARFTRKGFFASEQLLFFSSFGAVSIFFFERPRRRD